MAQEFHFKIYSNFLAAAHINNTIMPDPKISLLDCNILSLVRSFHDSNRHCYMTNEQLAKIFLSCEKTIKTSLNRLYWRGFVASEQVPYESGKKRILVYRPQEVEKFIQEMRIAGKNYPRG